jgi:hypothetical protein
MEVSGQLHASAALLPGKEPPIPSGYEVGWTPEPVWTTWRRESSWPYRDSELWPLGRPAYSQSLHQLRYPSSYRLCIGSRNWKSGRGSTKGYRAILLLLLLLIIIIIAEWILMLYCISHLRLDPRTCCGAIILLLLWIRQFDLMCDLIRAVATHFLRVQSYTRRSNLSVPARRKQAWPVRTFMKEPRSLLCLKRFYSHERKFL